MEQQAQLRDVFGCEANKRIIFLALNVAALHEALTTEFQCLKLAKMELREDRRTFKGVAQQAPVKHRMWLATPISTNSPNQQPNKMQQLSVPASTTSTTASTPPASA